MKQKTTKIAVIPRPPIVVVLGHVDHGKTTLLDYIRQSNIASKEHGGITQHIGAYQVEIPEKNKAKKKIAFIDTPGHEAFIQMRSRGAQVADLAILVVAANDGVMPQTKESIQLIKKAKIPCIVAVNKIDLPDINLNKIKKQLTHEGLNLEEYGGETPLIPLSATTGKGVDKLLEMIILLAELYPTTEDTPGHFKAVVIESSLSKNKGIMATIVLTSGNLTRGDEVICENQSLKVRALLDWNCNNLPLVQAGMPTQVLGWKLIPKTGSLVTKKDETTPVPSVKKEIVLPPKTALSEKPPSDIEKTPLTAIIKADTAGTLDAILSAVSQKAEIISSGVGNITESDIFLAKTAKAIIIGFNITPSLSVIKLASSEKVIIKTYSLIYELLQEIDDVIAALLQGNLVTVFGEAKILALFPFEDKVVAGVKVLSGRIARGDQVKIVRNNKEISRAKIISLRHGKENINKAEKGIEAGILLSHQLDLLTDDSIISIG